MRILISGTASGLGASLLKRFGGEALRRSDVAGGELPSPGTPFDMIVHCAVDTAKTVSHETIDGYFRNNVELTRRLVAVPHRRFVYLSSVDVYPKTMSPGREDAPINAHDISGVYGIAKFYAEALVMAGATAPLIVRASALLGPGMRENSLTRIMTKPGVAIGLSGASSFNYVRHEDVGDLIEAAGSEGLTGIVNCCSSSPVTLEEIRSTFGLDAHFGDFLYRTPEIDNRKAAALVPGLARTSLEAVRRFREDDRGAS